MGRGGPACRRTRSDQSQVDRTGTGSRGDPVLADAQCASPTASFTAHLPVLRSLAEDHGGAPAHRPLYVSRADARRRLLNEDQVLDVLAPWGFERVVPGRCVSKSRSGRSPRRMSWWLSVVPDLRTWVFMPPGGTVVMLSPSSLPGVFFWDIAHHLDVEFVALWGRNDGPSGHGQHSDFWMDIHHRRDGRTSPRSCPRVIRPSPIGARRGGATCEAMRSPRQLRLPHCFVAVLTT
jgi:hypothetical protein